MDLSRVLKHTQENFLQYALIIFTLVIFFDKFAFQILSEFSQLGDLTFNTQIKIYIKSC